MNAKRGYFYTWAWWEVLPSVATLHRHLGPVAPPAVVNAGDSVTVSIERHRVHQSDRQQCPRWHGTNDGTFTTQQLLQWTGHFGRMGRQKHPTSTDLLRRAPAPWPRTPTRLRARSLARLFGVSWGLTGNEADLYPITMVQGGEAVSTPSPLGASSFDVDYTGAFESRMGTTDTPMHDLGATGTKLLYPTSG